MAGWLRPVAGFMIAFCCWTGTAAAAPDVSGSFQRALEQAAAALPASPGIAARVLALRHGIDWRSAVGMADPKAGTPLSPDQPFRVASVTKIFVGAAILRLAEEGRLALSQPIDRLVSDETRRLLLSGGYDPRHITVRQLMDHTSGIRDFYDDPAYEQQMLAQPQRRWTRHEQIAIAMKAGPAYGKPGERFHYADTGYSILGEILERTSGKPMAAALRGLLPFDRLGLRSTWLESLEPPPPGVRPRSHQFVGDVDMTAADPSYDLYGAGGLVSTLDDLSSFFRGIFRGAVFRDPATLASGLVMQVAESGEGYGGRIRPALFAPEKVGPHACLGQGGYYGTLVVHCPSLDLTVVFNANTADPKSFDVADGFMAAIGEALGTEPVTDGALAVGR